MHTFKQFKEIYVKRRDPLGEREQRIIAAMEATFESFTTELTDDQWEQCFALAMEPIEPTLAPSSGATAKGWESLGQVKP